MTAVEFCGLYRMSSCDSDSEDRREKGSGEEVRLNVYDMVSKQQSEGEKRSYSGVRNFKSYIWG